LQRVLLGDRERASLQWQSGVNGTLKKSGVPRELRRSEERSMAQLTVGVPISVGLAADSVRALNSFTMTPELLAPL
jgi:hypothetical protein